jgi:hypothetical protein
MYNTKYECRYHKDNVFLDTDEVLDNEKDYIRNILYNEDLSNILNIGDTDGFDNFDTSDKFYNFDTIISEIYKQLIHSNELRECMRQAAATIISENEEVGLCVLFSYDFLFITHTCICEYLETSEIGNGKIQLLKNTINNNNK